MGIKRTASGRQIDVGMQNQSFLSILRHKMQKYNKPNFPLYFWVDPFVKCVQKSGCISILELEL